MATKPVIVGVDGSEESLRAVEWAALEARRHGSERRSSRESAAGPGRGSDRVVPSRAVLPILTRFV